MLSVAVLALICFIFYNSAQNGEESSEASGFFTDIAERILGFFGISVKQQSLSHLVRKAAHFAEYFMLSLAASNLALNLFGKKIYIALAPLLAFTVAVCDEFIVQGSTVGRAPQWSDVFVDLGGAVTASLLVALLLYLRANRLCKKEKTK